MTGYRNALTNYSEIVELFSSASECSLFSMLYNLYFLRHIKWLAMAVAYSSEKYYCLIVWGGFVLFLYCF